ncbi:MAG TPA: extracellular solute-binding protein [Clostridia bacterium]|nr:extracellular solute-binding protein [Clostridia bacterium]
MKCKRFITMLIALILVIAVLAGCGQTKEQSGKADPPQSGNGKEETPQDEKPGEVTTYTAFINYALTSMTDPWETPVGKKITELTGVKLKTEYLVGTDARQKAGVMIASGDYPDIIVPGESTGDYVAAGAFVPLDDYLEEYGENIKQIYRPSELELLKMQYGTTYHISGVRAGEDTLYPTAGFYLVADAVEKAGWPVIKTLDEYADLLKDYVQKNPEYNGKPTIAFTLPGEGWRMSGLQYGAARFLDGYPNDGPACVDQETLEAKVIMTQDFNLTFLKFVNELWNMGIADKEMFMQTNDQYLAKISSGRVAGVYDQRGMFIDGLNALEKQELYDRMLIAFPVVNEGVEREYYRGPRAFATQSGIAISTKAKDPEGIFKFFDRMAAEDVNRLNKWGIEGEDYTMEDGKPVKTQEQWDKYIDADYQKKQGINQFDTFPRREDVDSDYGRFSDGNLVSPTLFDDFFEIRYKDYEKDILKNFGIKTFNDFYAPSYPATYEPGWAIRTKMPADFSGKIAVEQALELATEYLPKVIMAKTEDFDKVWSEYQDKLSKLDLKSFEDEMTKELKAGAQYYQD